MTGDVTHMVEQLRRAFDQSFAQAVRSEAAPTEDLLAIHVGDDPYALRLADLGGLFVDRRVVAVPSTVPEFLGIAGMRGVTVPIYDLRRLLGCPGQGAPRWLALARGASIGLAFDRFNAHLRVPCDALAPESRSASTVRHLARTAQGMLPVIHLPSILEMIDRSARLRAVAKEI